MNEPSKPILLIEDNEDDVFVLKRALNRAQITNPLQVVNDGQQALDYLSGTGKYGDREQYPLPFIIFLDLKLPYVSGFEFLTWFRKQASLSSIVVIVLTSSGESRDHEKAYSLGARSYVVKPPEPKALSDVLAALESHWLRYGNSTPVRMTAKM
jgi:CheY-like chemotaxis protein